MIGEPIKHNPWCIESGAFDTGQCKCERPLPQVHGKVDYQSKHIETIYTHPDDLIFKDDAVYPENSVTGEIYEGNMRWFECYGCGFRFDAAHSDDRKDREGESYTCPTCEHPRKRDELVYLAAPFSGTQREQNKRMSLIANYTIGMIQGGQIVFSPIVYCARMWIKYDIQAWTDCYEWDLRMLRKCDRLVVLMLDGWKESKGVGLEIAEAERLGMPIEYREA